MSTNFLDIFETDASSLVKEEEKGGGSYDVELYKPNWKEHMKDGKYVCKMRFLTNPFEPNVGNMKTVVKYYLKDEQLQMNRYFNSSLSVGDKSCPIYKLYWQLQNAAKDNNNASLKQYADRTFNYQKEYLSYVYIIKDYNNPVNDGKVFLYPFKKQVLNIINEKLAGDEIKGKKPVNVFHPTQGADFILDIRLKKFENNQGRMIDVPNYESSEFTDVCPFVFDGYDCSTEEGIKECEKRFFTNKEELPDISKFLYTPRGEEEERQLQTFIDRVIETKLNRRNPQAEADMDAIKKEMFGKEDDDVEIDDDLLSDL